MGHCSYFGLAPLRFGYEAITVFSALRHCSYFGHGPLQLFRPCAIEILPGGHFSVLRPRAIEIWLEGHCSVSGHGPL